MLLQASGIQKYFGAELCLADISFSVNEQDRIGIIGQNGAGKTTLLKLITGEYEPDAGELSFARGVRVGYLEQNAALHPQRTVYQEMQDAFAPVLAAMQELQQVQGPQQMQRLRFRQRNLHCRRHRKVPQSLPVPEVTQESLSFSVLFPFTILGLYFQPHRTPMRIKPCGWAASR